MFMRRPLDLAIKSIILAGGFLALSGCVSNGSDGTNGTNGSIYSSIVDFLGISAPVTTEERNSIRTASQVTIAGENQAITYNKLLAVGDVNNGETFGVAKDYTDAVITDTAGPLVCNGDVALSGFTKADGSGPDHMSLLQKNGKLYSVTQFECSPSAMYMVEVDQAANGTLSAKPNSMKFVSQKSGFGGWVHCAGMTTPWQTHLGSEEYEPDAKNASANGYFNQASTYFWKGDAAKNNPYYYGWTPEVGVDASGNPVYAKHYAMGRFAHELAYVMPDNKTVYLSDDGANVGLFMFVADTAGDLSAGKLYAAKWTQVTPTAPATGVYDAGEAILTWIDMGSTTNAAIKAKLDPDNNIATNDGITFSSIFNTETPSSGACPTPGTGLDGAFKSVNTTNGNECLSLKDLTGDSQVNTDDIAIASRLETRRMAAILGATTEFNKEEGITFNARDNKLYVAMSAIEKSMLNAATSASNHTGGNDHIQLTKNSCGAVYELAVGTNSTIGSNYVAFNMKGILAGKPLPSGVSYNGTALGSTYNTCDVDAISMPDNLSFLEGSNTLIIGEDTGYHAEDFVWAYDIDSKELTRVASMKTGAESTSPFWHKNVNGKGYLSLTTQHPYGETPSTPATPPNGVDTRSEVGFIGPFNFDKLK